MTAGQITLKLFEGFGTSVAIFFATLVISLPLGLIFTFLQRSKVKPIKYVMETLIWIVRGTPLMLQIMIIFFAPGLLFGIRVRDYEIPAVLIAFSINYACYFAVIFKGGINSVAKGQYEACQVLGMTKKQTFTRVVAPQVYKNILAPMSNEIITLVKDTSLANVISVTELILTAKIIMNQEVNIIPLFSTGLFYLVFVGILTLLFNFLEKKTQRYR